MTPSEPGPVPADPPSLAALVQARQTTLPRRLAPPGPDAAQLAAIVGAAGHAPDHGRGQPWRLIAVGSDARAELAQALAEAVLEREPQASPDMLAQARDKAHRSPVLLLVVVDTAPASDGDGDAEHSAGAAGAGAATAAPPVPPAERLLACGCAVQNMLLMATAQGFGSSLTSGASLQSAAVRRLFGLRSGEQAVCWINIGTVASAKPPKARPAAAQYVSTLTQGGALVPMMCVDKAADELASFAALQADAGAAAPLRRMTESIRTGVFGQSIASDRQGVPVQFD